MTTEPIVHVSRPATSRAGLGRISTGRGNVEGHRSEVACSGETLSTVLIFGRRRAPAAASSTRCRRVVDHADHVGAGGGGPPGERAVGYAALGDERRAVEPPPLRTLPLHVVPLRARRPIVGYVRIDIDVCHPALHRPRLNEPRLQARLV